MAKIIRFPRRRRPEDRKARPLFPGLGGGDARPAQFASDAVPHPDRPRGSEEAEADHARRLKRRRTSALAGLALVFVLGTLAAIFGERGYLDNRRQRADYKVRKVDVETHQARYNALRREVETLQRDPHAIERIAREDLEYADKGEVVLLLPGPLDEDGRSAIVPSATETPR